jgi:hypothetical protein
MTEIHRPSAFSGVIAAAHAIADLRDVTAYRQHMTTLASDIEELERAVVPGLESATTSHDAGWPDLWLDRLHRPLVDLQLELGRRIRPDHLPLSWNPDERAYRAGYEAWGRALDSLTRMRKARCAAVQRVA